MVIEGRAALAVDLDLTRVAEPAVRAVLLERPALAVALDVTADWRVSVVCAPPRFGKRTALVSWLHGRAREHPGQRSAWLQLDAEVAADAGLLARYLALSLERALAQLSAPLQGALQGGSLADVANALHAAQLPEDGLFVVVCGFEHAVDLPVGSDLMRFGLGLPAGAHLVLVSAAEPPFEEWGVVPLLDCGLVGADAFLFAESEVEAFYDALGYPGSQRVTGGLVRGRGGWPLWAFAEWEVARGTVARERMGHFAQGAFASMLAQLPPDLCEFVEQTCFLDWMSEELVDAVLEHPGGACMLERLGRWEFACEDAQGRWELYAPLRRHLVERYGRERTLQMRRRNRIAFGWYAARGLHAEAARQMLLAIDLHDPLSVTRSLLPEDVRLDSGMVEKLATMDLESFGKSPNACAAIALCYLFAGNGEEALHWTRCLRTACASMDAESPVRRAFGAMVPVLEQKAYAHVGESGRSIHIGEVLLEDAGVALGTTAEALVRQTLGEAYEQQGRVDAAAESYESALMLAMAGDNPMLLAYVYYDMVWLLFRRGRLDEALLRCREALTFCPRDLPVHAGLQHFEAMLQVERGDQPDFGALEERAFLVSPLNNPDLFCDVRMARAHGQLAAGDATAAFQTVATALAELRGMHVPRGALAPAYAQRALFALCAGVASEAAAARTHLAAELADGDAVGQLYLLLTDARLEHEHGEHGAVARSCEEVVARAREAGLERFALQALVLESAALLAAGEEDAGEACLVKALEASGAHRQVFPFLPYRAELRARLFALATSRKLGYLNLKQTRHVLLAYERMSGDTADGGTHDAGPLSPKEREVLYLLSLGYSREEMADALFLSLNTVKTHLKHAYAKLGAHNRAEAVQAARGLGLLG